MGDAYDQLSEEASRIAPGSDGVVFLPAMQGAMAPEWNGAARGVFYGLTLAHTRDHMTRAILEGSAFGLRDILEAMKAAGLGVRRLTIVGGGAKGPLWRQIKADVTGLPVRVPESVETTATGAAILAAVGSGVHGTVADAVKSFVSFRPEEHEPDPAARDAYDEAYSRYRDVYFALKPVFATRSSVTQSSSSRSMSSRRFARRSMTVPIASRIPSGALSTRPSSSSRASLMRCSASSSAWRVSALGFSRYASKAASASSTVSRTRATASRTGPSSPIASTRSSIAFVASRNSSVRPLSEKHADSKTHSTIRLTLLMPDPYPRTGAGKRYPRSKYRISSQSVTVLLSKMTCSCWAMFSRWPNTKSPNASRITSDRSISAIASCNEDGTRSASFDS